MAKINSKHLTKTILAILSILGVLLLWCLLSSCGETYEALRSSSSLKDNLTEFSESCAWLGWSLCAIALFIALAGYITKNIVGKITIFFAGLLLISGLLLATAKSGSNFLDTYLQHKNPIYTSLTSILILSTFNLILYFPAKPLIEKIKGEQPLHNDILDHFEKGE